MGYYYISEQSFNCKNVRRISGGGRPRGVLNAGAIFQELKKTMKCKNIGDINGLRGSTDT